MSRVVDSGKHSLLTAVLLPITCLCFLDCEKNIHCKYTCYTAASERIKKQGSILNLLLIPCSRRWGITEKPKILSFSPFQKCEKAVISALIAKRRQLSCYWNNEKKKRKKGKEKEKPVAPEKGPIIRYLFSKSKWYPYYLCMVRLLLKVQNAFETLNNWSKNLNMAINKWDLTVGNIQITHDSNFKFSQRIESSNQGHLTLISHIRNRQRRERF